MPPESLASRSLSFSLSQSESDASISLRICAIRSVDLGRAAATVDDGGGVLVDDDAAGLAELLQPDQLELVAELRRDDLAAGEDRHVLQHRLAAVAEAGRLHRADLDGLADRVDHEGATAPGPRRPRR